MSPVQPEIDFLTQRKAKRSALYRDARVIDMKHTNWQRWHDVRGMTKQCCSCVTILQRKAECLLQRSQDMLRASLLGETQNGRAVHDSDHWSARYALRGPHLPPVTRWEKVGAYNSFPRLRCVRGHPCEFAKVKIRIWSATQDSVELHLFDRRFEICATVTYVVTFLTSWHVFCKNYRHNPVLPEILLLLFANSKQSSDNFLHQIRQTRVESKYP